MRLTFVTLALASWLGISGLTDPLWTILLERVFAGGEKEGAGWDPNGRTVPPPAGGGADPNGSADAGGGWDPNG